MLIYLSGLILFCTLVTLSVIDLRTYKLPDVLTLPLIVLGLGFGHSQHMLPSALIGAVIGYTGFVMIELFYKHVRGIDGLGRGDAKLLAAGGAWCGWFGLAFIILIASAGGLVHALLITKNKTQPTKIPFGPHLALGIFLTWLALFILR